MRFSCRTRFIVLGVGLALAGAAVGWWASAGPPVPVYNGRPISEMLEESSWREQTGWELNKAVRKLQGNAVPYLVHVLKNEPTTPQRFYHNIYFRAPKAFRNICPNQVIMSTAVEHAPVCSV